MEFAHISYEGGTGKRSKEVETYNFHKAAAVLAEYGFDCIRLADDWQGADFLAFHKESGQTLRVQLKASLVVDKRYKDDQDLYMCFPLDKTMGNWYLIRHSRLLEIVRAHAPKWLESDRWKKQDHYFSYTGGYRRSKAVLDALEEFSYRARYDHSGFRECATIEKRKANASVSL